MKVSIVYIGSIQQHTTSSD